MVTNTTMNNQIKGKEFTKVNTNVNQCNLNL